MAAAQFAVQLVHCERGIATAEHQHVDGDHAVDVHHHSDSGFRAELHRFRPVRSGEWHHQDVGVRPPQEVHRLLTAPRTSAHWHQPIERHLVTPN